VEGVYPDLHTLQADLVKVPLVLLTVRPSAQFVISFKESEALVHTVDVQVVEL